MRTHCYRSAMVLCLMMASAAVRAGVTQTSLDTDHQRFKDHHDLHQRRTRPPISADSKPSVGDSLIEGHEYGRSEQQALQLFSTSPALFVENQGQWSDSAVRYAHDGCGVDVAMTDNGVLFRAMKRSAGEDGKIDARDTARDLMSARESTTDESDSVDVLPFSTSFVGADPVRPVGLGRSESVFNYCLGDPSNWS